MGAHLIDGQFQSDKYPTTPRGKVPLSVKDPTAQDLLWEYAQRRRAVDAEFADDLEVALRSSGHDPEADQSGADRLNGIIRAAVAFSIALENEDADCVDEDRALWAAVDAYRKATKPT